MRNKYILIGLGVVIGILLSSTALVLAGSLDPPSGPTDAASQKYTLEQIYERHVDFVWRTVRRLGVPEAEARDAVQDVFLAVHAHLKQFEGRSSLATWIFTICRSVARERRRREQRSRPTRAEAPELGSGLGGHSTA